MIRLYFTSSILSMISVFMLTACTTQPKTEETTVVVTPPESPAYWRMNPSIARTDEENLAMFAKDIQTAPDAAYEGDAIQRLHQFETEHNLTYKVQAIRVDTDALIASPSTYPYPVRVDVTIFRQTRPVYSFSFVPRDNRNLSLMGG